MLHGDGTTNDRICQTWFRGCRVVDFSLNNVPRLAEVENDKIKILRITTENSQHSGNTEIG